MALPVKDAQNTTVNLECTSTASGQLVHHNTNSPFLLRVARGTVTWASVVRQQARNESVVGSGSPGTGPEWLNTIEDGAQVFLTTPQTLNVTSTSGNDALAGTGAQKVYIEGLTTSYAAASETVDMNGSGLVVTSNSYLRINLAQVTQTGSLDTSDGTITVQTAATPAQVISSIEPGDSIDFNSTYTVPAGYTAFVRRWDASSRQTTSETVYTLQYRTVATDDVWYPLDVIETNFLDSRDTHNFDYDLVVPATSDIGIQADRVSGAAVFARANYTLILVQDSQTL